MLEMEREVKNLMLYYNLSNNFYTALCIFFRPLPVQAMAHPNLYDTVLLKGCTLLSSHNHRLLSEAIHKAPFK